MNQRHRSFDIIGRGGAALTAVAAIGGMLLFGGQLLADATGHAAERVIQRVRPAALPAPALSPPEPVVLTLRPSIPSAAIELDRRLTLLGSRFEGQVGLAVRDIETGWTSHHQGLKYFPQQSVSKLWVALAALDQADRGNFDPNAELVVRREDLTLFHQPISSLALRPGGYRTTGEDLLFRALTQSDNSANDRLLNRIGGPDAVRTMLSVKGIGGIRFGPGERLLQSQVAGLEWKPGYSIGRTFYIAREALSDDVRRAAFDAYIDDPIDGATPLAMVDALARLQQGKLLSTESTAHMLSIMSRTRTGPSRLKGGLDEGWTLSHKTGTGQVFAGEQAGYNDVGILTSPGGRSYAVAVLIGRTGQPLGERMALMQKVVQATIDYDRQLAAQRAAAADPAAGSDVVLR